jgi:hypothetical protein
MEVVMKTKSLLIVLLIGLVALFFTGCAKVPQEKVDAAKMAVEEAKTAEANRYLPQEFNAAQDSLNAATAEIEKQNAKFALFRNYDKAAKELDAAKMIADEAKVKTAVRKEEVKKETEGLLSEITMALEETKKLLKKAPRGKGEKAAVQMIESDLTAVEAGLGDVNNLLTSGDFLNARDKAQASLSKVNSLKTEIQTAIDKKKGKK